MRNKILVSFCVMCVFATFLYIRLGFLATSDNLKQVAQNQGSYTLTLEDNRGQIYDANLNPFVNQATGYKALVAPTPENLKEILDIAQNPDAEDLQEKIKQGKPFIMDIKSTNVKSENIKILKANKRYTDNQLAPHIIGHLQNYGKDGATGIEYSYNEFLNKNREKTTLTYFLDGLGNMLKGSSPQISEKSQVSKGVVLTLDKGIQYISENIGKKYIEKGSIVIMEANTGNLKAVASFPTFSPNKLQNSIKDEINKPMINRALSPFSVGSTFKIVTAACALENGISKDKLYDCKGYIDVDGQLFHCYNKSIHGLVNMETAMIESCNTYFIDVAVNELKDKMLLTAADMSFGKSTELAPNFISSKGTLPTVESFYNPATISNFSFGQGDLLATPIQIAQMINSIINGGTTVNANLIEGFSMDGVTIIDKPVRQAGVNAISSQNANYIKDFLIKAVMDRNNQKAKPNTVAAGGKTATAQTGKFDKNGVEINQTWFGGFFPAENPQYVAVVLVENGELGNINAGPVFSEIADQVIAYNKNKK